ncbi:unnamed protein product [Pleuronectes platessa]|uniref:Uncharacterized protein n=1 Tax=Pleuronectes platessa TaxID=8262 RepID=A0A9N7YDP9_PLEPL|nr:unnamed protein product [Pleuronectes platessa]
MLKMKFSHTFDLLREEEGTQDGTLRNPTSERTRFRHISSSSYPLSAVIKAPDHLSDLQEYSDSATLSKGILKCNIVIYDHIFSASTGRPDGQRATLRAQAPQAELQCARPCRTGDPGGMHKLLHTFYFV